MNRRSGTEEKIATLNLSQKEIDSARQIYRKVQTGRPKGFIVWLLITKNEHIAHLEKGIYSTKDSQYPGWAIGWERTNTYSYNYDAAGQLQTKDVTYGDTYSYSGDSAGEVSPYSVETEKYEYVFGNYYIYTPAN